MSENTETTKVIWVCKICGHVEEGYPDGLPKDYVCPVCGAPAKKFKRKEVPVHS